MNTTTHVSQAEASKRLSEIQRVLRYSQSIAVETALADLRRFIAQGAPEGQAVAWQLKCRPEYDWRECSRETFERGHCGVASHACQVRALYTRPIPRAKAAGVRVPDAKPDAPKSAPNYLMLTGIQEGWNACRAEVLRLNAPTNSADIGSKSAGVPDAPPHAMFYVGSGLFAICDWSDWELVCRMNWKVSHERGLARYALAHQGLGAERRTVSMHRIIMQPPEHLAIDHINGDGLDNRRANLRVATASQNAQNMRQRQGRYKGVSFDKECGRWRAYVTVEGVRRSLGRHATAEDAARVYNINAKELFGEFAQLNEIAQ